MSYSDSYNNGNSNLIDSTAGSETFTLGIGVDWVTLGNNDTINLAPDPSLYVVFNQYTINGDNNIINVGGDNTYFWLRSLFYGASSGYDNTIQGQGYNDRIALCFNVAASSDDVVDFSHFSIAGISRSYSPQ